MEDREYIGFKDIKFFYHPKYKYYLASRCGQILSLKRKEKKILKLQIRSSGYLGFQLYENDIRKDYLVHRFVYETFKGKIPKGLHTDHCDNNKKNNNIINLQLLSHPENTRKSCCKKVISFNLETKEKNFFDSIKEAGEYLQINFSNISKNCKKIYKTNKSKKDGKKFQFFYL